MTVKEFKTLASSTVPNFCHESSNKQIHEIWGAKGQQKEKTHKFQ